MGFSDVSLDLGGFLSGILKPVVSTINSVFDSPLGDILNLVTTTLPGISDLSNLIGRGDVSLLSLASSATDESAYGPLIHLITNVIKIAQDLDAFKVSGQDVTVDLGSFDLSNYDLRENHGLPAAGDLDNLSQTSLTSLTADDPGKIENLANILNNTIPGKIVPPSALQAIEDATKPNGFNAEFHIPMLEDPAGTAFGLLLGKDTPLVTLTVNAHLVSDGSKAGDLSYFGAGVTFGGTIRLDSNITFGYDTYGLRKVIQDVEQNHLDKIPADITAGFYIDKNSTLTVAGSIGVMAGASYGLVGFSLNGAITTGTPDPSTGAFPQVKIGFDPNHNGNIRFPDLFASLKTSGELDADLSISFQVGVTIPLLGFIGISHTFDIGHVVLVDLNSDRVYPPPPPVLATQSGGTVTLLIGATGAPQRRLYDAAGHLISIGDSNTPGVDNKPSGENYRITHVGNDPNGGETIAVTAFGATQTIHNVKTIVCDSSDTGDLTIDADGITSAVNLEGGSGHAYLTYSGKGICNLTAGTGGSTLTGGTGNNFLTGGSKDDQILAGGSPSTIIALGAGGTDSITLRAPIGAVISGGDPKSPDTLEVIEPAQGSEKTTLMPTGGVAGVTVVVHDQSNKTLANLVVNNITRIVLDGGDANNNAVTVGDLSTSGLRALSLNVSHAPDLSQSFSQLSFKGSAANDIIEVNPVPATANEGPTDHVSLQYGTTGPTLDVGIAGLLGKDQLAIDGAGGNQNKYTIQMRGADPYSLSIHDAGSEPTAFVDGQYYPTGSVDITDSAVQFHYTLNPGASQLTLTNGVTFVPNIYHLKVQTPATGGESISANRAFGTTNILGSNGDDTFRISGLSTYTLYGYSGKDVFSIVLPITSPNVTIVDGGYLASDTLIVDDRNHGDANAGTDYTLSSTGLTRVAHQHKSINSVQGDSFPNINANYIATIAFGAMGTVIIDTSAGIVTPNTIDVESTSSISATTINGGDGTNHFQLTPVAKNLNLIAGPLTLNGGIRVNDLELDDHLDPTRLGNLITATPTGLTRIAKSLFVSGGKPFFSLSVLAVNYSKLKLLTVEAPGATLLVDNSSSAFPSNVGTLRAIANSSANPNDKYQITSLAAFPVNFFSDLASVVITRAAARGRAL